MLLAVAPLSAGRRHIVFDDKTDFSMLRTFAIQEGRARTTRPELNNPLIFKNVEDAIRAQLVAKGLKEASGPDILVNFSLGQDRPNGPSVTFDEGVIVVQVTKRDVNRLIWHGTYRDDTSSPAKLAEQLPVHIRNLLAQFPPKKK